MWRENALNPKQETGINWLELLLNKLRADKDKLRPIPLPLFIYEGGIMEKQIIGFYSAQISYGLLGWMVIVFYFAQILASRFVGEIVYDPIEGFFVFG